MSSTPPASITSSTSLWRQLSFWLTVVLPTLIVAIAVILILAWRYDLTRRASQTVTTDYQLAGPNDWVKNRHWQIYDAQTRQPLTESQANGRFSLTMLPGTQAVATQSDWQLKFLFTASSTTDLQTLTLSKDLDNWWTRWRRAALGYQWQQLFDVSSTDLDESLAKNLLNQWLAGLTTRHWQVVDVQGYQDLERTELDLILVWTLANTQTGQLRYQTTGLVAQADSVTGQLSWNFDLAAFPTD